MSEEITIVDPERREKIYNIASGLVESIPYIIRFERKVIILKNAARKFGKLGDYKDSAERAIACQKAAAQAEAEGGKESFAKALEKEKDAKFKSDFVDAIEEFNRTKKMEEYAKECEKHIQSCKEQIIKLEKGAVAKRRLIALGIVAVIGLIFWRTPGYPFVKGFVYEKTGDYKTALANFKLAANIPGANGQINNCYYEIAADVLKNGEEKKALKLLKKTVDSEKANIKALALEQKLIEEAELGQRVIFGDGRWTVVSKKKSKALLVYTVNSIQSVYAMEDGTSWRDSEVFQWLNTTFVKAKFTGNEQDAIIEQYIGQKASGVTTAEKVFVLNEEEYRKYNEYMMPTEKNFWLRDDTLDTMEATYVSGDGKVNKTYANDTSCRIRPAIWVSLQDK